MLSCIGVFLVLYEGYSTLENRVLDVAGFLLVCVAFFPLDMISFELWGHRIPVQGTLGKLDLSVHGVCAGAFFVCIIYVSTVLSGQTLRGRGNDVRCRWLLGYWSVSLVMAVTMILALIGHQMGVPLFFEREIFWVETVGVVAFAIFWLMKTREVNPNVSYRLKILVPLSTAAKETAAPKSRLDALGPAQEVGEQTPPSALCTTLRRIQGAFGADHDVAEPPSGGGGLVPGNVPSSS